MICIVKMLEHVDYKTYDKVMDITLMNMNNDLQLSAIHQVLGARFISRRFFWDTENISNVIYIVMSDDYQELADGLNKVTSDKFWNPSARFIIVVQNTKEYSLHDLTHLLHTYNIFHKVSVISRNGDVYAIYRYNFTKPGNCFRAGHLIFWSWCSDFISGKKLAFLTNGSIRNCRFEFIAQNLWPFMNFDNDVKGSEQYFLAIFQKQYRVQIVLKEFTKFNKYGKPVDNIRKIIHEKVVHNEYEGAVGGFSINSAYSVPYTIQASLYSVTARPARAFEPKIPKDLKEYQASLYTEWQRVYAYHNASNCGTRLNCLLMVKNCQNKSVFTIVSDAHFQVHRWQLTDHHCEMLVYQIKEPYMSIYRTVSLRRGSVLIEPLSSFTLQFESTGIMKKYISEIYNKNWLKCKPRHKSDYVSLKLTNFYNVFKIFFGVMCEDYQELADGLYKVSSDRFWNPSARFIIIVMNMEENSLQNFTNILHRYNIFKVSVISRNGNEYAIYKYNVTKPGTCLTDGLLTFWSWCSDYCSGKLLPPLNPGSIRGCRYKFYAHNVWPFTNFDTKVKGTEQYLLTLFDKHYGTKIEIVEYNKVDKYGNPVSNVSEIILKKVAHNKIEGALGGYSVQSVWGGVSYGYPLTTRPVRRFEPKVASDLKNYQAILPVDWVGRYRFAGHRVTDEHCNFVTYNLKEPYSTVLRTIYLRRGSVLLGSFKRLVLNVADTGILMKYDQDMFRRERVRCRSHPDEISMPVSLEKLHFAFIVLIVGCFLSFILFITWLEHHNFYKWQHSNKFDGYYVCGTKLNCLLTVKNCLNRTYIGFDWTSLIIRILSTGILIKHSSDIYNREWIKCKSRDRPQKITQSLINF
ncbi:hypothetical protein HW555_006886 [Spodoptera exigua]|uniref:Ionotropic receptor n=1 Tax=Spodoptera exigua TaxID=7107 RepID=A0A835L9I1_SPOEX|nr:hypothetical protein HW555_006886 [Spodoptera exigua]